MQIMSVVDHLDIGVLLNKINILDGEMRTVQVGKIDLIFILCQPVPDTCLVLRPI